MNTLSKKLKDQRGASIIIALLFFLMCTILGGIILMSAHTSAGRIDTMRQEEQAYLTVASAADVLRHEMSSAKVTYTRNETFHMDCGAATTWSDPVYSFNQAGKLKNIIERLYDKPDENITFTIEAPDLGLDNVTVVARMNTGYDAAEFMNMPTDIVFNLKGTGDLSYALSFKMNAKTAKNIGGAGSGYTHAWGGGTCTVFITPYNYETTWPIGLAGDIKRGAQ